MLGSSELKYHLQKCDTFDWHSDVKKRHDNRKSLAMANARRLQGIAENAIDQFSNVCSKVDTMSLHHFQIRESSVNVVTATHGIDIDFLTEIGMHA